MFTLLFVKYTLLLITNHLIMFHHILLPHRFKKIGWLILSVAILFQIIVWIIGHEPQWLNVRVFAILDSEFMGQSNYFHFITTHIGEDIIALLFILGALCAAFSKEKKEDEFISNIRLSSMLWAVLVNYILLVFAFIFFYGLSFFNFMILNMFTILIIFLGRFNYILYRTSKASQYEK
jgi:hypothetical protein